VLNTLKDWGGRASTATVAGANQIRANLPPAETVQKSLVATGNTVVKSLGQGVETIRNLDKVKKHKPCFRRIVRGSDTILHRRRRFRMQLPQQARLWRRVGR
jgi:hypothetical protein